MVRMSEILKKAQERKAKAKKEHRPESKPHVPLPKRPEKKEEKPKKHEFLISQSFSEKSKLIYLNRDECVRLYDGAVDLVGDIYNKVRNDEQISSEDKDIIDYVEKFVDQQHIGNEAVLDLINRPMKGNFIYNHAVNVSIISIELGIGLGYDKTRLVELGTVAMLHDVGMMKFYDLYNKPKKFTRKEHERIKRHAQTNAEILECFKNIRKKFIALVSQEHERVDGSGYPKGLKRDAIDEAAQIIGLADMYEAMTHNRPHRAKIHPYEVLKVIIKCKRSFRRKILKALIERINCPYPLGSYVRLNSGEQGKVIKRNIGIPIRPVVEITHDAQGEIIDKPKMINLFKNQTVYIKSYLKVKEG